MKLRLLSALSLGLLGLSSLATPAFAGGCYDSHDCDNHVNMDHDMDMDTPVIIDDSDMEPMHPSHPEPEPKVIHEEVIIEDHHDFEDRYNMDMKHNRGHKMEKRDKVSLDLDEPSNDNYFGLGYKTDKNRFGVISKVELLELGDSIGISTRNDVYFDTDQPELRNALSVDFKVSDNLTGYVGGGVNTKFEGDNETTGLIITGAEVGLSDNLGLVIGADITTGDDSDAQGKFGLVTRF